MRSRTLRSEPLPIIWIGPSLGLDQRINGRGFYIALLDQDRLERTLAARCRRDGCGCHDPGGADRAPYVLPSPARMSRVMLLG